ncbi:CaiB/BaiF CoA transferase family protein [Agrococcus jejuensis]|uniref:CoA-transferase family III n=1 Tax=Agrococcus jejuensis TaxID=399736 RepID=A0A1G8DJP3_9MICO|nr:CoA transferase [Agrococcus jejuensis]SDH57630.1 CoA-transferase family III [Agrococcus jejuensis]
MTEAPLAGMLVADLSRVLAGPLVGQTLADLGARVVKVERTGAGDDTRAWAPPRSATGSTYFDSANRGKESMQLDLADPADQALAAELVARADVVVENFKPGTTARLGLDRDALLAAHPRLVWCSISGYGTAPGGAERPGYDFVMQAMSGLMHITGEADGPPTKAGVALVDVLTAKDAVAGILAALLRRERTGVGGVVEVALLSSAQAALVNQLQAVLGAPTHESTPTAPVAEPMRAGSGHPSIAPYQLLEAADGPLAVAAVNDAQFARLSAVLGVPDLATEARFATNTERVAHRAELVPLLERALAAAPGAEWEQRMLAAGLVAGRVRTVSEGLALAREVGLDPTRELHGAAGRGTTLASPIRIDGDARTSPIPPPLLGQHDAELRAWLSSN